jgi:hypothetical protein
MLGYIAESVTKVPQMVKPILILHIFIYLLHHHHYHQVHAATAPHQMPIQRTGIFNPLTISSSIGDIIWVSRLYDVIPMASQAQCIIQCLGELTCACVTYSATSLVCTLYAVGSTSYNISVGDLVTFTIASKYMVVSSCSVLLYICMYTV